MRFLLHVALAVLLAATAAAADYVKLLNGTYVKGEAVSFDDATQTLTFRMEDGTERKYKLDELDKRSVYLVNQSRVPLDDAAKQIRIANLAREVGLYAHAARHYGYALKADPAMKPEIDREMAQLKKVAAEWGMAKAKAALAKGDRKEAEKWLVKIVEKLPDEPQAQEAAAMLEQTYVKQRTEREIQAQAKAGDQLKQDLQAAKKAYDGMVAKTNQGLTSKTTGSKSTSAWESAIADGKRALSELDKVGKKYPDPETTETLGGYRKMVTDQMVELHLHLASVYTTRSSYNNALTQANQALALEPDNPSALAARARIEQAAAERGWFW